MNELTEKIRSSIDRQQGYCGNCNTNVLHVRCFNSRPAYLFDKLTKQFLARFGIGPWQCVDCGDRNLRLTEPDEEAIRTSTDEEQSVEDARIGNFIRTDHSLAGGVSNSERFTGKYRNGVVERLLAGKSTVSRICNELNVSELEIQRWIKDYLQLQLDKVAESQSASLIPANFAGVSDEGSLNWGQGNDDVIEVNAVRKPR